MMKCLLVLLLLSVSSCASVEIYQVSRQTVMEEEAMGEWPDFEKLFQSKKLSTGPQFLPETKNTKKIQRLMNVLPGEFVNR